MLKHSKIQTHNANSLSMIWKINKNWRILKNGIKREFTNTPKSQKKTLQYTLSPTAVLKSNPVCKINTHKLYINLPSALDFINTHSFNISNWVHITLIAKEIFNWKSKNHINHKQEETPHIISRIWKKDWDWMLLQT